MALVLTKYVGVGPAGGTLAAQIAVGRRSLKIGGDGAGGETGLQRIGVLTSIAGNAHTCYYDPSADAIIYDDGLAVISQE